jgi:DNA-binding SARP family transcriptional activator
MSLGINLLGRPHLDGSSTAVFQFRSRKSWALLAFLLLSDRRPSRAQLATLLFGEADDPLRALRWNLTEIRRGLGDGGSIEGDPVVLTLAPGTVVDVDVVTRGSWRDAVALPGLGAELLEGIAVRDAAAFESWLLAEQRHVAAASEAILHEAALGTMSHGDLTTALGYAVRAAAISPFDENHQALIVRLYRLAGDDVAAERQFTAHAELLGRELGVAPGAAIEAAMRETRYARDAPADEATIEAIIEAGAAAISAGAVDAGVQSLRTAVRFADSADATRLRVRSRLVLAEALVHSLRGLDEEGVAALFAADEIALAEDDLASVAQARAEIGYVDFLRARYDRAQRWLTDALELAGGAPAMSAKISSYLGSVESDRADYGSAVALLDGAIEHARSAGDQRRAAYGLSMWGRIALLSGDLHTAARHLDASVVIAEREHWLSFLPWPQALRGEVQLLCGDVDGASELLNQAFARACHIGDPCWEGIAARALALVAESRGDTAAAFAILADARTRSNRFADPYVWLDGYILDAQCELGRRHGHADTRLWVDAMQQLASRTGMKELMVRALLHGAAMGGDCDWAAAATIAEGIENPALDLLLARG